MESQKVVSGFKKWAPGPNPLAKTPDEAGKVAGFWRGLLHGSMVLINSVVSLFRQDVHIYEVHNNGAWYNLGFLLGVMGALGGGRGGARLRHTPRRTRETDSDSTQ